MKICIDCGNEHPLSNFYKNKKMKDGHLNSCKYCRKEVDNKYKQINKIKLYKQTKDWKLRNKEVVNTYMKEYRLTNKDKISEVNKLWIETNKEKVRGYKNYINAQRRANKKCAFVKWADSKVIKNIYKKARELTLLTGIQHHVDHIVPLVNNLVCGLHCEHNLRIIPYYENCSKGNKLIEDIVYS